MKGTQKVFFITSLLALVIVCTACAANQQSNESTNQVEQEPPEEIQLDFDLPEDYEETAKQLASDFTIRWAEAYRSNDGYILEALLDDYADMIDDEPRHIIITAWNNDHDTLWNTWQTYVAGPTVSSVEVQDNYIEDNAVHLTIAVSMTATIQTYTTVTWRLTGSPISVIDSGTYKMYCDSNGWHFKTVGLRLNG